MTRYVVYEVMEGTNRRTGAFKVFRSPSAARMHLREQQTIRKRKYYDWKMEAVDHMTYSVALTFKVYDQRKQEYVDYVYDCEYTDSDICEYLIKTFATVEELAEFVSDFDGDFQNELELDDCFEEYLTEKHKRDAQDDYDEKHH